MTDNSDSPKPLPKCWVCGKDKKGYVVIMNDSIMSFLAYEEAREKGDICERCWKYFCLTSEFKDATEDEFRIAEVANWFGHAMLRWWEKDGKMLTDSPNLREWAGTFDLKKWFREDLAKHRPSFLPKEDKVNKSGSIREN